VTFAVQIDTSYIPCVRSKFGKNMNLENFCTVLPLTLEVQRENTP